MSAISDTYTCAEGGKFASLPSNTLSTSDIQHSALALEWLKAQQQPSTPISGDGSVVFSQAYSKTYTGPVSGTFNIGSFNADVVSDASIEITSHSSLPDNFNGAVSGKVLTTPTAWRWIIQVYKEVNGVYTQVPKQALADATTGEFTIDLSDVVNPPAGVWAFGILDAEASYAPYGEKWPAVEYYDGLEVQLKLVTDGVYDWATTPALASNSFTFDDSNTGTKLVRLVNAQTNEVLAQYVPLTGLVRSYQIDTDHPQYGSAFGDEAFVYDQAVALFAALSVHDAAFAKSAVDGLLTMQEVSGVYEGGFVFAAPQLGPEYRNSLIRTGAHAIATDALLAYIEQYPADVDIDEYKDRVATALTFIDETKSTSGTTQGLYLGGYGDYSGPNGSFVPSTQISWASTEHNIDIWHAFMRAAAVLGGSYESKADALQQAMASKLLSSDKGRYNQGMTTTGPDTADPLDVSSWGAMQLYATGRFGAANISIDSLDAFKVSRSGVTGYAPFYDSPGYPGATPTVWYEGSYGVLMALARTGKSDEYTSLLSSLKTGQELDGSFRYATDVDSIYEISDHKSVASTAWFVLATTGLDAMWNRCVYVAQVESNNGGGPTVTNPVASSNSNEPTSSRSTQGSGGSDVAVEQSLISTDKTELAKPGAHTPEKNASRDDSINTDEASDEKAFNWTPWIITTGVGVVVSTVVYIVVRKRP